MALNPVEGVDLASARIIVLAFFLVWLAESLRKKKIIVRKSLITLFLLSFLFLSLFSLFFAENLFWGIRKALFLLSFFPFYFVIGGLDWNKEEIRRAIKFWVLGSAIMSVIGIAQFFLQFWMGAGKMIVLWQKFLTPFLGKSFAAAVFEYSSWPVNISGETFFRATAFFPDAHMFSFYLGMSFFLALGLWRGEEKKFFQKVFLISAFLILTADLLTFSRGGYLGLAVGSLVFGGREIIFFLGKKEKTEKKKLLGLVAGSFLLIFLLLFFTPIGKRTFSSFDMNEFSNTERIKNWKQAVEIIKENPWVGTGLGNYSLAIKPSAEWREPIYAHNLYLDIVAEAGILGGLAFVALLTEGIFAFMKKARANAREKSFYYLYFGIVASFVVFSVHSFFDSALYSVHILPLLIFLLSLGSAPSE